MKYSIKVLKNNKFQAYLIIGNRSEWCKRTAKKHVVSAMSKEHFQGCEFCLEEN